MVLRSTEVATEGTEVLLGITQVATEVVLRNTGVATEGTEVLLRSILRLLYIGDTEVLLKSTKVTTEGTEKLLRSTDVSTEGTDHFTFYFIWRSHLCWWSAC